MSVDRKEGRRKDRRAFRPTLDGTIGLESRFLLSLLPGQVFLRHPQPGVALKAGQPPFRSGTHAEPFRVAPFPRGPRAAVATAHGGASVVVGTPDGSHFLLAITQYFPTGTGTTATITSGQSPIQNQTPGAGPIQPIGTVRAYPISGGRVGIIVDGTTNQSELTINPYPFPQKKGYAHSFAYGQTKESHILNVGQIIVNSGQIAAIEAYHTADLSGPLSGPLTNSGLPTPLGPTAVDRIAFDALLPGASIQTSGDLNTLDVLNGVNLDSGPGIIVGRDLNLLNVGQNLNLSNGASIKVGRFLGATPQAPKGTSTGSNFLAQNQSLVGTGTSSVVSSISAYIQGDLNLVGADSVIAANNGIASTSLTGSITTSTGQIVPVTSPAIFLINGMATVSSSSIFQQVLLGGTGLLPSQGFTVSIPTSTGTVVNIPANFVARSGFVPPLPSIT